MPKPLSISEIPDNCRTGGFTLIELSIVLVIIGFIVGGVLVGRDLIRSSELQSIITDKDRYKTAVYTFRSKFNELPGDMSDATTYWGVAGGNASDNYTTSCDGNGDSQHTATCNGDGNGQICTSTTSWQIYCHEGFLA